MITISPLTFTDLQGLKTLYENGFEGSKTDISKMQDVYSQIANNQMYNVLCAKIENKIVGSVLGVACHELFGNCQPFMVVEDVVVHSDYRRMGIATQLMIELENSARELNCSMIIFVSSAHRSGAHKLYESLGYGIDEVNGYRKRL